MNPEKDDCVVCSGYLSPHNVEAALQFQVQRKHMLRLESLTHGAELAGTTFWPLRYITSTAIGWWRLVWR